MSSMAESIKNGFLGLFSPAHLNEEVRRRIRPALAIGLLIGGLVGISNFSGLFAYFENKTIDMRFLWRGPRTPDPKENVVIVAIDDQSLENLQLRWPCPRSIFAKAIDSLSQAGAKVIAFDLVFSEASDKELKLQDRLLGDAIVRSRSWIVMASKFESKSTTFLEQTSYIAPIPNIDPAKSHVGFVNISGDEDHIYRHAGLVRRHLNKYYESFGLKVLERYYNLLAPKMTISPVELVYGDLRVPVERGANLRINFRGGPGSFPTYPFDNLLDKEAFAKLLSKGAFKDKIVLIGPTFAEAKDVFPTPFLMEKDTPSLTAGVEIHANILDTIINKLYFRTLADGQSFLLILLLSIGLALIIVHLKPLKSLIFLVIVASVYGYFGFWLFTHHRMIAPLANPVLALFLTYLVIMVYRVLTEERRSRQIRIMFSRYVSPKVVEVLIKNPEAAAKMGGSRQMVTVLFSDIRGFTAMSEQLPPETVVELLNEYFQAMTDIIFAHDGMVDKFIGDAIMAMFGVPMAHPDDPLRAVRTAVRMQREMERLQTIWAAKGRRTFNIGVGVNTGEVIVGNMGSMQAMGYTAIGDTVNLASRLESANKDLGTSILISDSTYAKVKDHVEVKEHPGIMVKGKANALTAYEVIKLVEELKS